MSYRKTDDALAKLTPEQYRVTQIRTVFPPDVYSVPAENQILDFYKKP